MSARAIDLSPQEATAMRRRGGYVVRVSPGVWAAADTYGYPVVSRRRHRLCRCAVACQKRFRCRSRHHRGSRATPWCNGGEGESCDACWCKEQDAKDGAS